MGRPSFLGTRVPAAFSVRRIVIAPGCEEPVDEREWEGAIVAVQDGEIALVCHAGGRRTFAAGSVLWFAGLSLRSLCNPGAEPAVLVAVSRRRGDEFDVPVRSGPHDG